MNRAQFEAASLAGAKWYPASDNRIVATVFGDTKIVVDQADFSVTPHLVMSGYWESWISVWALSNVQSVDKALNIGANCGYYTMLFARRGAEVVAVEPQPKLANGIQISAALNGWSEAVKVYACVAGRAERPVRMRLYDDFHGSAHVMSPSMQDHPDLRTHSVDAFEQPAHDLMPDATVVFIDAEGYEPCIWDGLSPLLEKNQLRWVALEWAPVRYGDSKGFIAKMREYGTLATVRDDGSEVRVSDDELLSGGEWDTLVVRRH
ncbi:MAG: hypothetical protein DRH30_11090 [Deltaproteobacteria bacterium]|nr:MAG: hypothetical protein DRH30_11090 [Deltaproteobacteria bacterium]RLB68626.1 MAG: hypothetical protein DRH08_00200 [Deltaproteobacteria bacterium]